MPIRVSREQRSLWRVAAAKSDMGVGQWILSRLGVTKTSQAGSETEDTALGSVSRRARLSEKGNSRGDDAVRTGATVADGSTPSPPAKPTPTHKPCMLCKREVTDWVVVNGFYVCGKCFNKQA